MTDSIYNIHKQAGLEGEGGGGGGGGGGGLSWVVKLHVETTTIYVMKSLNLSMVPDDLDYWTSSFPGAVCDQSRSVRCMSFTKTLTVSWYLLGVELFCIFCQISDGVTYMLPVRFQHRGRAASPVASGDSGMGLPVFSSP